MGKDSSPPGDKSPRIYRTDKREAIEDVQLEDLQRDSARVEASSGGDLEVLEDKVISDEQAIPEIDATIIVKLVQKGRGVVLLQWIENDSFKRGWLPATVVTKDWRVKKSELRKAIPYGIPLHECLKDIIISTTTLIDALHKRNIWTEKDVLDNPEVIGRAITAAAQLSVSKVQTAVRRYTQGV